MIRFTLLIALTLAATAQITIDTVPVGNPGNPPDPRYGGHGAVAYEFEIGTVEVTTAQYVYFLNCVAGDDSYGLYNVQMADPNLWACNIIRSGPPGDYVYDVAPAWSGRPVNFVNWGDAARFCNWLHNGQPKGKQDLSTTESGSYWINGAMSAPELLAVVRCEKATWAIPSENEWYKAAYFHAPARYWNYPTCSDVAPDNGNPLPGVNSANYFDGGFTIGAPYFRTPGGWFAQAPGPFGTFDMGGNVFEWNDAILQGVYRGVRGGCFFTPVNFLHAASRGSSWPLGQTGFAGFRVVNLGGDPD